ncbi:MAG: sigma-70 family RNA polymerase sigma factor [Bacteroides thetaiotaomicron]
MLLVELALNQLPPRRKQVFEMSRIEGLSHKEIAEKLQIPVRTVEDHIYKTLTELHKVLMFVILPVLFP